MSYSLHSLRRGYTSLGSIIGVIRGNTRSLDYRSYRSYSEFRASVTNFFVCSFFSVRLRVPKCLNDVMTWLITTHISFMPKWASKHRPCEFLCGTSLKEFLLVGLSRPVFGECLANIVFWWQLQYANFLFVVLVQTLGSRIRG